MILNIIDDENKDDDDDDCIISISCYQISSLAADIATRDFNGVNSSPEPVKEEEPSLFDSFKEAVTESLRDDEPQRSYAAAERSDSPHESEVEDIPIEETIQNKAADVLGDSGIPLQDLVDNGV